MASAGGGKNAQSDGVGDQREPVKQDFALSDHTFRSRQKQKERSGERSDRVDRFPEHGRRQDPEKERSCSMHRAAGA